MSYTYDDQGRTLTEVDPDQGTFTYTDDPDGHVLSVTQTSGSSSRTLGYNYDLLGRVGCEQTAAPTINATGACSAGSPLVQNTYDTNELGTQGSTDFPVGQLTQSVATTYYPDGTSATVTEQAQYDQRGRTIASQMQFGLPSSWNITTALPTYQLSQAYNDGDQPAAGNGTCGSGTLTSGLPTGDYGTSYSETNLGQLWQGPIPGNYQPFQYLYCNSDPHQLSGIYLLGDTCSSDPSSDSAYLATYDAWGNETERGYNSVGATLSYDALNHLVE